MKKNGFTLVELLAVITILGIMSLIAAPTVERITKENKEKIYQTQLDNIVLALKNWATDNKELLPTKKSEVLTLTLGSLKADGYLEYELKDPKNNKCFSTESELTITKYNNSYVYEVKDIISTECNNLENLPTIKLNGNVVEYLNIDDDDIYIFEDYCRKWGIKGSKWYKKEWNFGEQEETQKEKAERLYFQFTY